MTGAMPASELDAIERAALPTLGACPGQFTANTMGMVSEVIGLAPLGSSMVPAVDEERSVIATHAGHLVMQILDDGGPLPRDLVTRASLENAPAPSLRQTAGSTHNAALHIPAIAHEAGIRFTLDDVAAVLRAHAVDRQLAPSRRLPRARTWTASGACPMIVKALIREWTTLMAKRSTLGGVQTLAQAVRRSRPTPDGEVIRAPDNAISIRPAGVVVLKGNPRPDGALIKIAGLGSLVHEGSARVFENEEACMAVIRARAYAVGDVLVIRNEGPKGGPGMREMLG